MQEVECILIDNCLAPKRAGNGVSKKPFMRGQKVIGTVTNIALTPDSQVLALKTRKGYIIPEPFLNIVGAVNGKETKKDYVDYTEVQDAEIINDKSSDVSTADVVDGLNIKEIIKQNSVKSKYVVNFSLGGALCGLVYSMMKGGNKFTYSAVGAIGGGIVGTYIGNKLKENEKSGT